MYGSFEKFELSLTDDEGSQNSRDVGFLLCDYCPFEPCKTSDFQKMAQRQFRVLIEYYSMMKTKIKEKLDKPYGK